MNRVEFLKKFVAFNKRHKVPNVLIKAQLYVILVVCFIHYAIVKGIRAVKNAICYPFVKMRNYIKQNIRDILQLQCLVATIGICVLIVGQYGSLPVEQEPSGALAGETYVDGEFMGADSNKDELIDAPVNEMATGSVINGDVEDNTQSETQGTDAVNKNNPYPYKVMINRLANCVTIYTLDENGQYTVPFKAMICSTGGDNTPLGTFKIGTKYDFKTLFYKSYGQYCSRIYGSILLHSSGNNSLNKNDLNATDFNNLGLSVSHGCIRLTVADAKWIYDNCPSGTEVVVYDSENPGPLGKPESIKVPAGTNWDPTDPDPANPWHEKQPSIETESYKVLYESDTVDYFAGVKAYDTCGNDITEDVVVEGYIDITVPGDYVVKYSVTDLLGRKAEATVIYTVK
ncbi:MAG: L,D-transpeptidase family protein [Lachnospiraceae bacterium]|nr:L,D-transpeptidase family protein [Lachnospiraceae bacterium]